MSVDYFIHVKRKSDNKELGCFLGNRLKSIRDDAKCSELLHMNGRFYHADKEKFTYEDLQACFDYVESQVKQVNAEIFVKKTSIPMCANVAVKHELEDEISCLEERLTDLMWIDRACSWIDGAVSLIVEDLIHAENKDDDGFGMCAYEYNGSDLPKVKDVSGYDQSVYVWLRDVYFEIELSN